MTGDDVVFAGLLSYCKLQKTYETDPERVVFTQKEYERKLEDFKTKKIILGG